ARDAALAAGTAGAAAVVEPGTEATGDASGHDRQQRNEQQYLAAPANGERKQEQSAGQRQCAPECGTARAWFIGTRFFQASRRSAAGGDFYLDVAFDAGAERFAGGVEDAE